MTTTKKLKVLDPLKCSPKLQSGVPITWWTEICWYQQHRF